MNFATTLPVDRNGNAIPVLDSDSRKTQSITCAAASAVTAHASSLAPVAATVASAVLDTHVTFTANDTGSAGEDVSVQVAVGDAGLSVAVTGKAILITLAAAGSTRAAVKAAIEANFAANELVTVTVATAGTFTADAVAKTYLSGWDPGNTPTIVRLWSDTAFFYGKAQSAEAGAPTAEIPVGAGQEAWDIVNPGERICAKGTEDKIVYITPARKYHTN